ncbi:hypothetical protein V1264_014772 [Littorina saxatilis]|uniref:Coiled-coil domain-containing protein 149 n=1 Tax=Littorina saxatilis TaxID=31220 RepID=A0AAN9BT21_9CAEN
MAADDAAQLSAKYDALITEYQICRKKLESKCEALLILSRELAECRSERDQFKLMAEQLRERYQVLKRQLAGHRPMSPSNDESSSSVDLKEYASAQGQGLAAVLMEYREQNKSLQFEVDDLKQKLHDAQGDIKLLREQIVRSRVGTADEGMTTRYFPAYEREDLVKQLEASREQTLQLERDLQQVIDEKQELVTERDAYRQKYDRLNTELNYILKGDEKGVVDIDALIMNNKYLHERLKQMEEEKVMAMDTASKYKSILEKKKNKGILKVGQSRSGGLIISQKQVQQMMQNGAIVPTPQAMADLQSMCSALLDSANDKSLALSHQRKANKLLGNRVSELEKKLKTLEVAGLWSVSEHMSNLDKLRQECSEVKSEVNMLIPTQKSDSSEASDQQRDTLSDLDLDSDSLPQTPSTGQSPIHEPSNPTNSLFSPTHTPSNPTNSLFSPTHTLSNPTNSLFSPTHTLSNPTNSLFSPTHTLSNPTHRSFSPTNSPASPTHNPSASTHMGLNSTHLLLSGLGEHDMEADLDLLPTKEEVVKHTGEEDLHSLSRDMDHDSLKVLSLDDMDHDSDTEQDHDHNHNDDAEDDEEDSETTESEKSHLLGQSQEDEETVRRLQNFMESVTSKIRDRHLRYLQCVDPLMRGHL